MGHKKRNITTTSATSSAYNRNLLSPLSTPSTKETDYPEAELADSSAMKQECEKALNALRRGSHNKALRLMKESSSKFENSAVFHRVHGTIAVKVAGIIDDPNTKQRHYRNAVESARKAAALSPNSIEFAHFYASLLFDTANDGKDYEEVVTECERALSIENPIDPIKDNLNNQHLEDKSLLSLTAEARIAQVQGELRGLIQKSNIASISSWMKHLGGPPGEEKFRLIPLRKFAEEPLDSRYFSTSNLNARRPNEIKKATKTPEERRKEIEVRVAAARLLQQKSEQGQDTEEGKSGGVSMSSSLVSGTGASKVGDRRKYGSSKKNSSFTERKDQVRSFWNSLSSETKREFLSVRVSDLSSHFSGPSNKDGGQACDVLSEALEFGKINKTWKFWTCCHCGEKFSQADAHIQHVVQEHLGNQVSRVRPAVPPCVDNEWVEMLVSCSWKPLDLTASVRMLEDQSKSEDSEFSVMEDHKEQSDDCWNDDYSAEEVWDSVPEKKRLADGFWESKECDGDSNIGCKTCDGKEHSKVYSLTNSWPISDDIERAKLLEKISSLFQILIRNKCLAVTHLHRVIHCTMEELKGLFPGSKILKSGVDDTPLCICFLEANHLKKLIKFLQEVSHACGLGRYPEKVTTDDASNFSQISDCEERIILSDDVSSLLLDESLLNFDGVRNDVGLGNSVVDSENCVQSGSDSFLSWIYAGSSSEEQLATWFSHREEKSQQGMELLQMLEKEFGHLQSLCDRKFELVGYEEGLRGLEELCLEERKKTEHSTDISYLSFESLLRKRRDQLVEGDNVVTFAYNDRLELDAIANILKDAENINTNQFGYEETYGGVTSNICDLEAGEYDWRSKDYLHQVNTCIEIAIQRQKEQMTTELCKIDARILRDMASMHQLELKLEPVSSLDYRFVLVPLVKSYMRAHLEGLAEKDATEKSDAAREAFLAELALDSKKGSGSGNDNSKQMQDKMKDRKKNKDSRRSKDLKAGSYNEHLEPSEQFSLGVSSDGDIVDTDLVPLEIGNDIKDLEEEIRRKIELEAEERKLEETLEYQRRLENEAKQKLLAEQRRKIVVASPQDVGKYVGDVPLEPGFSVAVPCKQDQLVLKDEFEKNIDGLDRNMRDGSDYAGIANDECDRSYVKQGSSDGEIPNEVFPSERRTGRRGKRRSSAKLSEGRYQAVPSGNEDVKVENSAADIMQKDQVQNQDDSVNRNVVDGGSKTLRQLQAEEDEEERFQADLKKAVRQSLDTFQAHKKLPLAPNSRVIQHTNVGGLGTETGDSISVNVYEMDSIGAGLQNEIGEYNCFLNVIIQSLWHLKQFREEFLRRSPSEHVHVGDPCVVCALFDILTALSVASDYAKGEPVAPTTLRIALSNKYPDSSFFQEGQMNDASEVLDAIFECLHHSFTSGPGDSDRESLESNRLRSWDCSSPSCIVHTLFGMDIFEQMNCYSCYLESRHMKYTSFFHHINASALRTMKVMCAENSFDELLNFVEMNHQLTCDLEDGGCGTLNHIHHILSNPPHIFTAVLGWQNTCESVDDIAATLSALATEIDISVLYRGLDPKNVHRLVSVVCYYGQHYHCFAYSHDRERWIMYDDKTVKVIGTWEDVLSICVRGHLQPQVLFYEAAN